MPSTSHLSQENVWLERQKYEDAERSYQEGLAGKKQQKGPKVDSAKPAPRQFEKEDELPPPPSKQETKGARKSRHSKNKEKREGSKGLKVVNKREEKESVVVTEKVENAQSKISLADEISRARQHIKNSLKSDTTLIASTTSGSGAKPELTISIGHLEDENKRLAKVTDELRSLISKLEIRVAELEGNRKGLNQTTPAAAEKHDAKEAAADEDVDLFASDEENDEEKEKLHQERLKAYETKKSKKPALVAKSNIILDVKPWDDETDMKAMEAQVKTIVMDGLVWGASKLVPLAYGIHKLQISCVVEDEKVSVDLLQEQIESFDNLVQSVDIAAFNKV